MKTFLSAAAATVIAATFISAAAFAQPVNTEVRVSYSDLNLSTSVGQSTLTQRINAAADIACGVNSNERDLAMKTYSARCHKAAVASARTAIASTKSPVLASR